MPWNVLQAGLDPDFLPASIRLASLPGRVIPYTSLNWEGLACLERRSFLLANDKFPETILGFVTQ